MKNAKVFCSAMAALALSMASVPAQADPPSAEAVAKARQEYDDAMKGHDIGLQNAMKLQLAVLLAKSDTKAAQAAPSAEMPPLAKELNCVACHAIDHKVVGPAWQDVADRYTGKGVTTYTYKGKEYPLIEGLVMKVSQGGSGNWGHMPMPANDPTGAKKDKITELIRFEQGLARKNVATVAAAR